jgi:general secretion pathway protein I
MIRRKGGFTLIEVMAAAVVISVGFAAVWHATGLAADALDLTRGKNLAMWAAKNKIAEFRITNAWPELGETDGGVSAGNEAFFLRQTVTQTPSGYFRKVKIEISRNAKDSYILARLTAYLINEKAMQGNNEP